MEEEMTLDEILEKKDFVFNQAANNIFIVLAFILGAFLVWMNCPSWIMIVLVGGWILNVVVGFCWARRLDKEAESYGHIQER